MSEAIHVTADDTAERFCLGCGFALFGLVAQRCPECGRGFDPSDTRSWTPGSSHMRLAGPVTASLSAACIASVVGFIGVMLHVSSRYGLSHLDWLEVAANLAAHVVPVAWGAAILPMLLGRSRFLIRSPAISAPVAVLLSPLAVVLSWYPWQATPSGAATIVLLPWCALIGASAAYGAYVASQREDVRSAAGASWRVVVGIALTGPILIGAGLLTLWLAFGNR